MSSPATSSLPNVAPAFETADECRTWLAAQPLASTVQMQSLLQRQLGLLNRHAVSGSERLAILETLREQLYRTQEECQARFARRPIPLALPEQAAFDSSQATWRAFADGYVRCLESLLTGEIAIQSKAAQIIERILSTLVDMQTDIYRSSSTPPADHWQHLHKCVDVAEQLGVLSEAVKDRLRNPDMPVTIVATYAEAFLLHSASPYELGQKQMTWVVRWARRWSSKISLHAYAQDSPGAAPFYVQLDQTLPATHTPLYQGKVRVLDTGGLRRSLKKRMLGLSKGATPASLQLGDDCTQPAADQLLARVYQRWCKDITPRKHERRTGASHSTISCGLENAHRLFLDGRDFQLPGVADMAKLRREREHMATLGRPVEAAKLQEEANNKDAEDWQILDESANGMRLLRKSGKVRIAVGVLLTLQVAGVRAPLLGCVRWAVTHMDGEVEMGIQLIPGQAEALAVGGTAANSKGMHYDRALLLPAIAALKESSSLVLPSSWFEPGRIIELHDGKVRNVRLGQPIERGRDFDRVTFSDAP